MLLAKRPFCVDLVFVAQLTKKIKSSSYFWQGLSLVVRLAWCIQPRRHPHVPVAKQSCKPEANRLHILRQYCHELVLVLPRRHSRRLVGDRPLFPCGWWKYDVPNLASKSRCMIRLAGSNHFGIDGGSIPEYGSLPPW